MTALEIPAPFKVTKIRPQLLAKGKTSESLLRTDTLGVGVQVVAPAEGETNLHAHPGTDSTWVVLDGQATFYGTEDDIEIGVLDKNEAILIPEGAPYWFKCSSDNPLVILHITARTKNFVQGMSRKDYKPAQWAVTRDKEEHVRRSI